MRPLRQADASSKLWDTSERIPKILRCSARECLDLNACPRHLGRKRSARTTHQCRAASAETSEIAGDLSRCRPFRVGAAAGSICDGRPGLGQKRIRRILDRNAALGLQPEGQLDTNLLLSDADQAEVSGAAKPPKDQRLSGRCAFE
jgi:hypothetical protein